MNNKYFIDAKRNVARKSLRATIYFCFVVLCTIKNEIICKYCVLIEAYKNV